MSFSAVNEFEEALATWWGSPYAVAVDCCTHAIELSLRLDRPVTTINIPCQTYISVPFTLIKLGLDFNFTEQLWTNYYRLGNTRIVDAAVYWEPNGYKTIRESPHISNNPLVCLSFQFKKPLNLGRGGAILCSSKEDYIKLKKLAYDGRYGDNEWSKQDIDTIGYHYYMTPETATEGLSKLNSAISNKEWNYNDYPYLPQFNVFRDR